MSAPSAGAITRIVRNSAIGAGMPRLTRSSQYTNAMNIPMAPWAKLKMPEVVYVTTMPDAAMA